AGLSMFLTGGKIGDLRPSTRMSKRRSQVSLPQQITIRSGAVWPPAARASVADKNSSRAPTQPRAPRLCLGDSFIPQSFLTVYSLLRNPQRGQRVWSHGV